MPRLLLIDDDELLGLPLAAYFARAGFELSHATRPSTGLAPLRGNGPGFDGAILDVMLPEMDGFELCRTIRKESALPIVMLTARGDVMDRVVGFSEDRRMQSCTACTSCFRADRKSGLPQGRSAS